MFLIPRILYRYIFLEILPPFAVSLLVLTAVSFLGRLMKMTQIIVVKGVGLLEVLKACLYMLPYLMVFTLPMAAMVGILLALLRLSVDQEIMAMRTSGLSYVKLLPPVLAFALVTTLATLILSVHLSPWGKRSGRLFLLEITKKHADMVVREQNFNTEFNRMMLFVNRVRYPDKVLEGVLLHDRRDPKTPSTIYAERGTLKFDPRQNALVLNLERGWIIHLTEKLTQWHTVDFAFYQLPVLVFSEELGTKTNDEMGLKELGQALKAAEPQSEEHNRLLIEFNRRFAMPMAALLLCLIAMPLGLGSGYHTRTWGLVVSLIVVLGYYVIFTASWRLAVNGRVSPSLAPWIPDLVLLAVAAYLWSRTVRELPLVPSWQQIKSWGQASLNFARK